MNRQNSITQASDSFSNGLLQNQILFEYLDWTENVQPGTLTFWEVRKQFEKQSSSHIQALLSTIDQNFDGSLQGQIRQFRINPESITANWCDEGILKYFVFSPRIERQSSFELEFLARREKENQIVEAVNIAVPEFFAQYQTNHFFILDIKRHSALFHALLQQNSRLNIVLLMLYINGMITADLALRRARPFDLTANSQRRVTYAIVSASEMHHPDFSLDCDQLVEFYNEQPSF